MEWYLHILGYEQNEIVRKQALQIIILQFVDE